MTNQQSKKIEDRKSLQMECVWVFRGTLTAHVLTRNRTFLWPKLINYFSKNTLYITHFMSEIYLFIIKDPRFNIDMTLPVLFLPF